MVRRHSAFAAILALLLLPFAVSAQSPRNHDDHQSRWSISSVTVANTDEFSFARINSVEVRASVRLNQHTSLRFGAGEVKRYAPGTIVSPTREHIATFTIIFH